MQHKHRQFASIALAIAVLVGALALFSLTMTGAASARDPGTVIGDDPPIDTDCDGFYEDVDGDGDSDVVDVQAMFANRQAISARADATMFDLTESGGVNVVDVQKMFANLGEGSDTRLDLCEIERKAHEFINDERTSRGLDTTSYDTKLSQIARYHSDDMAEEDTLAHDLYGGQNYAYRYDTFDYQCKAYFEEHQYATGGENIYWETYESGETETELAHSAVDWWMNSTDHRENILTEYWDDEGIGVATTVVDGRMKVYFTQNFC